MYSKSYGYMHVNTYEIYSNLFEVMCNFSRFDWLSNCGTVSSMFELSSNSKSDDNVANDVPFSNDPSDNLFLFRYKTSVLGKAVSAWAEM